MTTRRTIDELIEVQKQKILQLENRRADTVIKVFWGSELRKAKGSINKEKIRSSDKLQKYVNFIFSQTGVSAQVDGETPIKEN
jgi:predicted RNA-binding protein Jag